MSYPKRIRRSRPRGLIADVPPYELEDGFASLLANVLIRDRQAQRGPPRRAAYGTLLETPQFILNARAQGVNWWLYASASAISAVQTSNHHDITPSGGILATEPHQWSGTRLNGIPILHNQQNPPLYWDFDSGHDMQPLPDWPSATVARAIVAFKYHLFAVGIDTGGGQFPMQVKWSDAAEPGAVPSSWTPTADNEAGDTELADTPGGLVTAAPLRTSLVLYKPFASYICDYVGGDEKFAFQLLNASDGAINSRAVAAIGPDQHAVVGDGDVYVTDGATTKSIADGRVKRFLFDNLNRDYVDLLQVIYYRARREVWVLFPEAGETTLTKALVWNQAGNEWGYVPLTDVLHAAIGYVNDTDASHIWDDLSDDAWDDQSDVWNVGAFASPEEKLVLASDGLYVVDEGALVSSGTYRRDGLTLGEPERVKFVKRVHVRAQDATGLTVRVGSSMTLDGSYTYTSALPVTAGFVNCTVLGKYLSVIVEGSSAWKLSGLDLEAEFRGYH